MRIDSIRYTHYKHAHFQGNKVNTIVEKLSMRDFYAKPDSSEFKELRKLYNNLLGEFSVYKFLPNCKENFF